ncbi:GntR family transcriptional regulator/MocR family aminotransferase [Novosphingobium chloroacetimidivorans]|uniref:GntR family transcriptional regulator/MocR family aminotransferase n=1 Tax=Novosphingobium chloroacetimidivorans TaxID=1428314 RepID=A0A7W7NWX4_9SPHN|nr:GntR family transcriptional regulator/MocR family aminotransferase [Novosphingobium chloroacetimidivorans]
MSRNTVALAYQELVSEGHLAARERSGIFVARLAQAVVEYDRVRGASIAAPLADEPDRPDAADSREFRLPPDWQRYRFPFIDQRFDRSMFPVAEWREASRLALGNADIAQWTSADEDIDDETLVEQIRARILPRRGIIAARNEILIVGSEQQALFLIAKTLGHRMRRVAIEDPGLPQTRQVLELAGAELIHQPVDDGGMVVNERLLESDCVYVTPSRQRPTGVTMAHDRRQALLALAARQNLLLIEDDFDSETTVIGKPLPALRAMPGGEATLYLASLSRALAPGIKLGVLCGPAPWISAIRKVRDLATHRPSPTTQRAAAHFLALGHYETMNARVLRVVQARVLALRDAINHYMPQSLAEPLPQSVAIAPAAGGSTVWVRGPASLDARLLANALERRGVLIEPAAGYFASGAPPRNMFRLGVCGIPSDRIREGVATIAAVMREMSGDPNGKADLVPLAGPEIARLLGGATLLYRTVYGEPCTMELQHDGTLVGRAGFANEELDTGRWWIEGDRWFRQWNAWAYGEPGAFAVVIRDDQIFWLDEEGRQVDSAVIASSREPPSEAA